ncbi:endonuclease/exonuclease/phosphatase family protein [Roseovarius salinarum]|uniref:endonuclease/exonuclease/phosphatase family protein n=1 Tax=Roseovarius salinarum TaxID=1981892 RepID=UPI0013000971|nr:endonuclease/exonuclease/phosphatase family protein [Roseovarius salinarum]
MLSLALLAAGYGGAVHPAGDLLAVFRLPLAGIALIGLAWLRRPLVLVLPGLVLVATALGGQAMMAVSPGGPVATPGGITLYQKNLLYRPTDRSAFLREIARTAPDVLTLQEVSRPNRSVLDALAPAYPERLLCPYTRGIGGVAVLSRWPVVPGSRWCASGPGGMAAMQLDAPRGRLWVVSLHLHWPWPRGQSAQVDRLIPVLAGLEGPVVVAGDFNAVAWSHTVARIARATRTERAGRTAVSFRLPPLGYPLGIDHVLAPRGRPASAAMRPWLGSDHRGVLARLAPPAPRRFSRP